MALFNYGNKVDKYYVKKLVQKVSDMLNSSKIPEKEVIERVVGAVNSTANRDEVFHKILVSKLRDKFPDIMEFQRLK